MKHDKFRAALPLLRKPYAVLMKKRRRKWPIVREILETFSEIEEIYGIRERFIAIYKRQSLDDAKRALKNWLRIKPSFRVDLALDKFRTSMKFTWKSEYLNYWRCNRLNNGFIEAMNKHLKAWATIAGGMHLRALSNLMALRHPGGAAERREINAQVLQAALLVASRPRPSSVRRINRLQTERDKHERPS